MNTELITSDLANYYSKLSSKGVSLVKADYLAMIERNPTIAELIEINKKDAYHQVLAAVKRVTFLYLNCTPDVTNEHICIEICRSIVTDFANRISPKQIIHAFNMASRGKIDVDLTTYYGKVVHSMFIDVLTKYCQLQGKARLAAKELRKEENYKHKTANYEEVAAMFFSKWDEELDNVGFVDSHAMAWAQTWGKHWVKANLVNVTQDEKKRIWNNLRKRLYTMQTCVTEHKVIDDEVIVTTIHKQVPIQEHPTFDGFTIEEIYTYLVLYQHFNNKKNESGGQI